MASPHGTNNALSEELNGFFVALNDEAETGAVAIKLLVSVPVAEWRALLLQDPSLCRYGTFDALLQHARSIIYDDPRRALAIVEFVLPYAHDVQVAPGAELLRPLLLGTAFKELANTRYALGEATTALAAAERALEVFTTHPALVVDHAVALLTHAQVTHELGHTTAALHSVNQAARIFGEHSLPKRYLTALEICGQILVDQREFSTAQDVYQTARILADQLDDPRTTLRLDLARGACAVYLGDLDNATTHLTRAFIGFQRENMHTPLQRAIWGMARVAHDQGKLQDALEALHGVYGEFLHRGMLLTAAEVLVEVGDLVAEMTGDVGYARETARRVAASMGSYDVPRNVREAVEYLNRATHASPSSAGVRTAFAEVRHFFEQLAHSPATPFVLSL